MAGCQLSRSSQRMDACNGTFRHPQCFVKPPSYAIVAAPDPLWMLLREPLFFKIDQRAWIPSAPPPTDECLEAVAGTASGFARRYPDGVRAATGHADAARAATKVLQTA